MDLHGTRVGVNLALVPDAVIGDWLLIHAGFAIQKVDEAVTLDSMKLIREYAEALEGYEDLQPEQPRSLFEV